MKDISDEGIADLWPELDAGTYQCLVADLPLTDLHHPPLYWHGLQTAHSPGIPQLSAGSM